MKLLKYLIFTLSTIAKAFGYLSSIQSISLAGARKVQFDNQAIQASARPISRDLIGLSIE